MPNSNCAMVLAIEHFVIVEALAKFLLQHFYDAFSVCCCLRILLLKRRERNRKEHFLSK